MSLVIPPGFGSAALIFTGNTGTQPFVTTIGVDLSGVGGDFVQAANAVGVTYMDNFATITTNALTLDRVTLSIGQDGPGGSVDSDFTPISGTSSAPMGPIAMSIIARKVTAQFGRYGRGRMFLPGLAQEAGVDPDGSVIPTLRTTINTNLAAWQADLADPGLSTPMDMVLLHSSALLGAPTPITSLVTSDLVGWIRGRIR